LWRRLIVYNRVKYFRRRQFVLGPEHIDYEGWARMKVADKYLLTIHPDLPATIVEDGAKKAVLLGYAIDPYHSESTDEDILKRFLGTSLSLDAVISGLEKLSGRFVLLIVSPTGKWLFPDTCALRQVNYCYDDQGAIWCASQPETLAERFGFQYDEEVLSYRELAISALTKEEYWLINDRTPYREVKYLLANHYLDLSQGKAFRFWPVRECIGSLSMDDSIKHASPIIQNSIKSAANKFNLKMGISAGSDSRRSLAATRDVTEKIYYFTHTPGSYGADMEIPARLLPKLGIEHHKHDLQRMSPEFRKYYESSATWARERRGNIAFTALRKFGSEATVLNSNISEIHQCWYWLPKSKINGEGLAIATRLNHPLAIKEFQRWIDGAKTACEQSEMNILVLFDYELRSRWVTAALSEYDIAHETFNPYNNRYLSCMELAIDERYRRGQRLDMIIKQIKYMWPDVLIEPINPEQDAMRKIKQFILSFIIHKAITPWLPAYQYLKYLRLKRLFNQQATQNELYS